MGADEKVVNPVDFSFFVKGDDDLTKRNVEHNQKHVKTS